MGTSDVLNIEGLWEGMDAYRHVGAAPKGTRLPRWEALTYGELTPAGVDQLIAYLQPGRKDVFYDLGSGLGKVVVQMAARVPLKKCVGIEIGRKRYEWSCEVLTQVRALNLIQARTCEFQHADALQADLSGATMAYTSGLCFPRTMLSRLAKHVAGFGREITFVTLKPVEWRKPRALHLVDEIALDVSWAPGEKQQAWVYRVRPL